MSDDKKANRKIIDVQHPGKSAPTPSSKPIIVTNRPILKDPMVIEEKGDGLEEKSAGAKTEEKPSQPMVQSGATIKPPEEAKDDVKVVDGVSETPFEEAAAVEPEPKPKDTTEPAVETTDDTPAALVEETEPDTAAEADQVKESSTEATSLTENTGPSDDHVKQDDQLSPDEAMQAEVTAQAQHEAALEKLAESKKYYLPIKTTETRRSRQVVITGILLSLVLVALWIDVALDAGLIHLNGVQPLTHFFSN
jgi:hypothetical protein